MFTDETFGKYKGNESAVSELLAVVVFKSICLVIATVIIYNLVLF